MSGKVNWGINGGGATVNGQAAGGSTNVIGNTVGGLFGGNGGGAGNGGLGGTAKGILGNLAGLGVNFAFSSAKGFQSYPQMLTNAMTYQTVQSMWSTYGGPAKLLGGAGSGAGSYGSQGPTDFFQGLSALQSLGGWTSPTMFKDMQSAIGGTQVLNPTLSYAQIAGSVGSFAGMPQTNSLRQYGINTYSGGKFTGSVQNIAMQLMQRMGIDGSKLSSTQIAEEGGPNSPLAQQLQMMVSNGALSADQADLIRQQVMAYVQGQNKGMSYQQVQQAQAQAANTGNKSGIQKINPGYGSSSLASLQGALHNGTKVDMSLKDPASALASLSSVTGDFAKALSTVAGVLGGGSGDLSMLSGIPSSVAGGALHGLGKVGGDIFGSGSANAAEPSAPSGAGYSTSMSGSGITSMLNSVRGTTNSCLADLAQALLGHASGYSGPNVAWNNIPKGHAHPGDRNPPVGAIVYWAAHGSNKYGHIGVVTKPGTFRSAGLGNGAWQDNPMSWESSNYLGWSDTIGKWTLPYKITAVAASGSAPTPQQFNNKFQLGAPKSPSSSVGGTLNRSQILSLVESAGFKGSAAQTMTDIAMAESHGNTHAVGLNRGKNGQVVSRDRGLFQINDYWHPDISDSEAFNPVKAAKDAYKISKGGTDFSAWSTYNNGSYLNFARESIVIHVHGNASAADASKMGNEFLKQVDQQARMRRLQHGKTKH